MYILFRLTYQQPVKDKIIINGVLSYWKLKLYVGSRYWKNSYSNLVMVINNKKKNITIKTKTNSFFTSLRIENIILVNIKKHFTKCLEV